MMNAGNLNGKARQMKDWRRRLVALVAALSLLISSCGLTAFAESDEDIYSAPVTAPIAPANTSPEPEEGGAEVTPAPEGQDETGTEPAEETGEETGTEPVEETGEETGTETGEGETEGEPEVSEEPEDLTVYESGTLTAEADGIDVTLDYAPEARIPEGAVLTLARATGGDLYSTMKAAARVLKEEANETWKRELGDEAVFYLLTLTNPEGIELHPTDGLTLTCTNLSIPAGSTGFVTGTSAENIDWDGELTLAFLPDAIGYANLKQVQIGTITLVHNDRDYMVTASYGPEAGFPVGTALKVREIMPGTPEYALYSGMTDEALNEDWSEITLERYFDIAFVKDDEELEPQAEVDVQITFHDKIEENEDTEVAAVHIENNEATVIESETDSQKVAKHDDEAIDTVTFTSDSFSVYGVVQKKKIITKILEAGGQTYEIGVTYTQEAEIPEDAQIKVEEIPEGSDLYNAYKKQTAAALNADDVRLPGLYDISIVDAENNKVEPKVPVSVAIKLLNDENTTEDIQIVHFKEDIPQELVEAEAVAQQDAQTEEITVEQTEDKPQEQTEVQNQPLAEEDKIESEEIKAKVEGDTVTFETQSFSVYAFAYTVDFYYGEYEYHLEGNGELLLSELFILLNIDRNAADVVSVEFSDPTLLQVDQIENDWKLISLEPFTTIESLTIKFTNGDTIVIRVEDAQTDFVVMFNNRNAGHIDDAGNASIRKKSNNDYVYIDSVDWKYDKLVGFKHKVGSCPSFTATAEGGYQFLYWLKRDKNGNETLIRDATLNHQKIANPDGSYNNITLIAFFAPQGKDLVIIGSAKVPGQNYGPDNYINFGNVSYDGLIDNYVYIYTDRWGGKVGVNYVSGYEFLGWYAGGERISQDYTYNVRQEDKNKIIHPLYWDSSKNKIVNVTVNDSSLGRVERNGTTYTYVDLDNNGRLHFTVNATPYSSDIEFLHWKVNGVVIPELSGHSIGPNAHYDYEFTPGDQLEAVFSRSTPITPANNDNLGRTVTNKENLHNWAESIINGQMVQDADKTASVVSLQDYENRIYKIDLKASSGMRRLANDIGIAFLLDMSASMRFPSNLIPVQKNGNNLSMVLTQENLNREFPGESGPYYIISDPSKTSTVYKIWKQEGSDIWGHTDGAYTNCYPITGTETYNDPSKGGPYSYTIYRDATPGVRRLDSLNSGLNKALQSAQNILSSANGINGSNEMLVAFNRFYYKVSAHQDFQRISDISLLNFQDSDTEGGTRQDLALRDAWDFNWNLLNNTTGKKYAILITDGAPVLGSGEVTSSFNLGTVFKNIGLNAETLRTTYGVTLITVGLSTRNVDGGSSKLWEIASTDSKGQKLFYDAEDSNELQYILLDILQRIMADANLQATVTDTIDPVFYPVQEDGTPITPGTYGDQTWTKNSDGSWTVTWNDQQLEWGSDGQPGWSKSIYVKAKEDFLGGNAMPTNKGKAVIQPTGVYDSNDNVVEIQDAAPVELDTPYVNVKELAFNEHSSEITVNLGDEVDPIVAIKELFDQIDVLKLVSGDTDNMITDKSQMLGASYSETNTLSLSDIIKAATGDKVTEDPMGDGLSRWAKLLFGGDDKTLKIRYPYGDHYRVGEIWISLDQVIASGETGITGSYNASGISTINSEHATAVAGDEVEKYILTVKYVPQTAAGREETKNVKLGNDIEWHTTPGGSAGRNTDEILSENIHIVNVLPPVEIEALKVWDGYTPQEDDQVVLQLYSVTVSPESTGTMTDEPTDPSTDDTSSTTDPSADDSSSSTDSDPDPEPYFSVPVNIVNAPLNVDMWIGLQKGAADWDILDDFYGSAYDVSGTKEITLSTNTEYERYVLGYTRYTGAYKISEDISTYNIGNGIPITLTWSDRSTYSVNVNVDTWSSGIASSTGSVTATFDPEDETLDNVIVTLNAENSWSASATLYEGTNYDVTFTPDGTVVTDVSVNNDARTEDITEAADEHGDIVLTTTVVASDSDPTVTIEVDDSNAVGNWWFVFSAVYEYNGEAQYEYQKLTDTDIVTSEFRATDSNNIRKITLTGFESGKTYAIQKVQSDGITVLVDGATAATDNIYGNVYYLITPSSNTAVSVVVRGSSKWVRDNRRITAKDNTIPDCLADRKGFLDLFIPAAYADEMATIEEVNLELPEDATLVDTVTLDGKIDMLGEYATWRAKWTNLPAMDDEGNLIYYYVRESSASKKSVATYSYTYDAQGKRITLVTISNEPDGSKVEPDEVEVIKKDNNNTELKGAIFTLYRDADCTQVVTTYGGTGISRFTISTDDGELAELLPKDDGGTLTLYLKETTPPTGYQIQDSTAKYTIYITTEVSEPTLDPDLGKDVVTTTYTMTIDGEESKTIENPPVTDHIYDHNTVTVYKIDGTGELPGATFALFNGDTQVKEYPMGEDTSFVISADDTAFNSIRPAPGGSITLTLKETAAPDGYRESDTEYNVILSTTETVGWNTGHTVYVTTTTYSVSINSTDELIVPNTPVGSIEIVKAVTDNGVDSDVLNGKTIRIGLFQSDTEPDDTAVAEDDLIQEMTITDQTTTTLLFENLELGTYWVYELDTDNHPVKNGSTVTIDGHVYTVTETDPDVDLTEAGQQATVSITNNKEGTGNLIVQKVVAGDAADYTKEFTFTVTQTNLPKIPDGQYGEDGMTFANGEATFTLKNGESIQATGLPYGFTYTVIETEANQDDYITTEQIATSFDDSTQANRFISTEETETVIYTNVKYNQNSKFTVKKKWVEILNPDEMPAIYFSLKYYRKGVDNPEWGQTYFFVDSNGKCYDNEVLSKDNNWTWNCPVELPLVTDDENHYQLVYFVDEVRDEGGHYVYYDKSNMTDAMANIRGVELENIVTSQGHTTELTSSEPKPFQAYIEGNEGTITITNRAPGGYIQMDLKKKWLVTDPADGALWTTTSFTETMTNRVIGVQLYRRSIENKPLTQGDEYSYTEDVEELEPWSTYGSPMKIGYNRAGQPYLENDNVFNVEYAGPWHWTIEKSDHHKGLPKYGYKADGTPVKYQYVLVETKAYRFNDSNVLVEDNDLIAVLPAVWSGTGNETVAQAQQFLMFPRIVAQDQDRLVNVTATDLKITKSWIGTPQADKIFIKVYRIADQNYNDGTKKDYTKLINTTDTTIGGYHLDGDGVLAESNFETVDDEKYICLSAANNWTVTITSVRTTDTNQPYRYWIEEKGYHDATGNHMTDEDVAQFKPVYSIVEGLKENNFKTKEAIVLQKKGHNHLKVENTSQTGSLQIKKTVPLVSMSTAKDVLFTFSVKFTPATGKTISGENLILTGTNVSKGAFTDNHDGTYTLELTITGTNTATISGIPYGTEYEVSEMNLPNGWHQKGSIQYESDEGPAQTVALTDKNIDMVTVSNEETVDVSVDKTWDNIDELPEGSVVTVELSAKTNGNAYDLTGISTEQTLTANTDPAWQYTWNDLPKYDEEGNLIAYTVEEIGLLIAGETIESEDLAAYLMTADSADTAYSFHLKNRIPRIQKTALKQWSQNTLPEGISVKFKIKATVGDDPTDIFPQLANTTGDQEQTLIGGTDATTVGNWTATWSNLPQFYQGQKINYTVTESEYKIGETTYTPAERDAVIAEGFDFSFTNELPNTEIEVTKVWTLNGTAVSDPTQKSIQFEVHQVVGTDDNVLSPVWVAVGSAQAEETTTPTVQFVNDAWQTVTVSKLPVYVLTTSGYVQATYYVVETNVSGDTKIFYKKSGSDSETETASTAAITSGTITICNRDYEVDIHVLKVEESTRGNENKPLQGAEFSLEKKGTNEKYAAYPDSNNKQTSGNDGKLTFANLPDGEYLIKEEKAPNGFLSGNIEIYFKIVEGEVQWTESNGDPVETEHAYVTYTPEDEPTFIVGNTPGAELPATGGSGTLIYTIAGMALVVLAGVLLVSRKRKTAK